ncbi:hypothetical protein [Thauera sp.]|uniref:hypothetical protein n=1 Tax=Thauera sp. TaxID=1905334 RepID=UPI002BE53B08|nr:hypothetical protein [Thauera sp.]HRP25548.1 hypothetical protein [Thauera sp.]
MPHFDRQCDQARQPGAAHLERARQPGVGFRQQGRQTIRHGVKRQRRTPGQRKQEVAQPRPGARCDQGLVAQQLVGIRLEQPVEGELLIGEQGQRRAAIRQRRVEAVADQLVVLDQPVVGVLRKGERRQAQGVDHRKLQQP